MWYLVANELRMLKGYFLQILVFLALVTLLLGPSTALLGIYPIVIPFMAMTLPQLSFMQEERGKLFVFLRSLPIKPADIVGAKYIVAFLVVSFFLCLLLVSRFIFPDLHISLIQMAAVTVASTLLASVSYFLHFLVGAKSARVAQLVVVFAVWVPIVLLGQNPRAQAWLGGLDVGRLLLIADSTSGLLAAVVAGCLLMLVSFAASAVVFTCRDVGQIP